MTEADQASERLIRTRIGEARPDDGFLGEEGTDIAGTSGIRWVVDPIDGTVNYLYGLPNYSVSIAAWRGEEYLVGVVLNPATGDEYAAAAGAGATLNGRPIRVRDAVPLAQSLVATGFNYEREIRADQGAAVARLLPQVRDIRRLGSCALDLCAVAAGAVDGYVEEGTNPWDYAAGALIAREAGATVELSDSPHGRTRIVAAPAETFTTFRDAVLDAGL